MASLPVLSGQEVVRVFASFGWSVARQKSSHIIMTKEREIVTLSIPNHKEVARGTLRSLIRSANLTVDELVQKLKLRDMNEEEYKRLLEQIIRHQRRLASTRMQRTISLPLRSAWDLLETAKRRIV